MFERELTIPNNTKGPLSVWVEPWAFLWEIPAGANCKFRAESEVEGDFELIEEDGELEVYGWSGSNLKIFLDDKLEWDSGELKFPTLPESVSVRGLVKTLFSHNSVTAKPKPKSR